MSHIWAIRFSTTKWSTEVEKSQFLYHPEHWKWEQPVPHSQPFKLESRDQQTIFSSWLRTRRIHSKYSSKDNILAENNTAASLFTREKKKKIIILKIMEIYMLEETSTVHLGPPLAQSRATFKIRPGCSEPQPIKMWKFWRLESPQPLWTLFLCSSTLFFVKNFPSIP